MIIYLMVTSSSVEYDNMSWCTKKCRVECGTRYLSMILVPVDDYDLPEVPVEVGELLHVYTVLVPGGVPATV